MSKKETVLDKAVKNCLDWIADVAKRNPNKQAIRTALCEIVQNGVTYQVQILAVHDKKLWIDPNEVQFVDFTKLNDVTLN
jgi:hypothetical protein